MVALKVEVSHKFSTPKTLVQQYLFIPAKYKVRHDDGGWGMMEVGVRW